MGADMFEVNSVLPEKCHSSKFDPFTGLGGSNRKKGEEMSHWERMGVNWEMLD